MKIDVFPNLNLPVIYVAQPYGGMDPAQMEGLLTFYYEYHFLYISGIHHVESQNIQGVALMKLFFHPGTDMAQAMAETVGQVNRSRSFMPPGTVAAVRRPLRHRQRAGRLPRAVERDARRSARSRTQAYIRVRPMLVEPARRVGPAAVRRQPADHRRPRRSRPAALLPRSRPTTWSRALTAGNTVSPSGNVRIQRPDADRAGQRHGRRPAGAGQHPPAARRERLPARRDRADGIEDGTDIPTSYALVNGRRAVYMLVSKRADASTLAVVNEVKANLPEMQAALPEDINVRFEFDQSPYVTAGHVGRRQRGRCSGPS